MKNADGLTAPYRSFNKEETEKFIWECCQMGGRADGIKAFFQGDEINVAWRNSITGETIAIEWDWRGSL